MDERWSGSIVVNRPVEEVYRYLADLPKHCEWAQTLERMELKQPGDASGVGARYLTYERQAFQSDRKPREAIARGMRAQTMCEVRELVPNRRIAWYSHPHPIKMGTNATISIDLEPVGPSQTRVTQSIRMRQPAALYKFFQLTMKVTQEKAHAQWQASLRNIKQVLEESPSPAPAPERAQQPATA